MQHGILIACLSAVTVTSAVTTVVAQAADGREIGALNLAGVGAGQLPPGIQVARGSLQVATKDGAPMLRATSPSIFVLSLSEQLPQDFTVEFDLIPKSCCNPGEDLAFEGTSTLSENAASAHLLWHPNSQVVQGGGPTYQNPVPASLRDALPGQLTHIVVTFQGTTVRMYTNGVRLYTLTDRRFMRGRVLRVSLGGQDAGANAVHLAGLRVIAGVRPPVTPTQGQLAGGRPPDGVTPMPAPGAPPVVTAPVAGQQGDVPRNAPGALPTGMTTLPARTIALGGLNVTGVSSTFPPRTIALSGLNVTGVSSTIPPRTIALSELLVTGVSSSLPPRTISLSGLMVTGVSSTLPPRTITLSGLTVTGITP